ncbi:SMI1/KNR4 family protein [Kitasatospora purpeofusca]|uniref:SMI1/KNR4 family protein n=1 Tax=Kitasatospora purpeofusca TaxID=67352 RepID=UPI00386E3F79|nr:SMI1/KNR4 family protein [Kitasatospora purpeofusca]
MSSLYDCETWEPLLRLLRTAHAQALAAPGGQVSGTIGRGSYSVPVKWRYPPPGRAMLLSDNQAEHDAIEQVRGALSGAGVNDIAFTAEIPPNGAAVLRLFDRSAATERGIGNSPGTLILVEGAVPEPWRRLPERCEGARPAPSADPERLGRVLRERIPEAIGATEEEIAAAERRLGLALPEEVKALYQVTRGRWEDWQGNDGAEQRVFDAVGFELGSLEDLAVADLSHWSYFRWQHAATGAVLTGPDDAVQDLVGSPGWIVLGGTGGGERVAVDLTPGPRGHLGQVIVLDNRQNIGASLWTESLTDLALGPERPWYTGHRWDKQPLTAIVHDGSIRSIEAAAHPALEVLRIGAWTGEPLSLAPVVGLPRLRTLCAYPGTLADPLEIAALTALKFLELAPGDWRALLDAAAVPGSLSAASVHTSGQEDPRHIVALTNEILALWDRPPTTETVVTGDLGPLA